MPISDVMTSFLCDYLLILRIYVIAKIYKKIQMQAFVSFFHILRIMGRGYGLKKINYFWQVKIRSIPATTHPHNSKNENHDPSRIDRFLSTFRQQKPQPIIIMYFAADEN